MLTNGFLFSITEHLFSGMVPASNNSLQSFTDDGIVRGIYNSRKHGLLFFTLDGFGNIDKRINSAGKFSALIKRRHRVRLHTPAATVRALNKYLFAVDSGFFSQRTGGGTLIRQLRLSADG